MSEVIFDSTTPADLFSVGKLSRYVKEIQGHMRLRASGDRHEIRQQYVPVLWQKTVKVLQDEGKEKVPDIIDLLDSYFLTKEDYDAITELVLGPMSEDKVKIDSQAKATFTRLYNSQAHPLPFMKASSVVAPKAAKKEKPDLEDAIDESDVDEIATGDADEVKDDEEEELDMKKDKYIKAPKKKKANAGKTAAKSGAKDKRKSGQPSAEDVEDDEPSNSDDQDLKRPNKRGTVSRGGRKARGKAAKA